jgi:hypothetical protein
VSYGSLSPCAAVFLWHAHARPAGLPMSAFRHVNHGRAFHSATALAATLILDALMTFSHQVSNPIVAAERLVGQDVSSARSFPIRER